MKKGFTLIELMITVAVISILSMIALPAYTSYVLRSKLSEAKGNLGSFRVQMEQYYQDNRNYGNPGTNKCGLAPPGGSDAKYFTYTCVPSADLGIGYQAYITSATGVAADSTRGFTFTIDQGNNKATTVTSAVPQGWSGNAGCWVTKQGGAC